LAQFWQEISCVIRVNFPSKTTSTPSKAASDTHPPRTFWKFGAEFHGDEALRADATDFFLFTIMALLCAWPIVTVAMAIVRVFLS